MSTESLFSRKPELARSFAQKYLKQRRAFHEAPADYAVVSAEDFPDLDLAFYDDRQRWLEQQGFVLLGDTENRKNARFHPTIHTFTRALRSPDGLIIAEVIHLLVKEKRFWHKLWNRIGVWLTDASHGHVECRMVSFSTQLSDSAELSTSVAVGTQYNSEMPGILICDLPEETPLDDVLATHRARLRQWLDDHPDGHAIPIRTLEDALASLYEWHDRLMAYERSIGYVSKENLIQEVGEQDGTAVYNAIQEILREEQGRRAA